MARIFISYAKEDGKEAGYLHHYLTLLGFTCFLAHKDIKKGELWRPAIVSGLKKSDIFIPLLSEHGLKSSWVQQECGMAHLLRGKKKTPVIIPVTPNGQIPPGCLSEYQALNIGLTFWLSKLDIGYDVASKLGNAIVDQADCMATIKPRAINNLGGTSIQDYGFILGFLSASGQVTFDDFLSLIKHADTHSSASYSDFVMDHMYRLLRIHTDELTKLPEWVKTWNRLHDRYQKHKEEERRRAEEYARKMQQQTEKLLETKGRAPS